LPLAAELGDLCRVRRVALLAQEWRARLQQVFHHGAVRIVAVAAILGHRLVLVDKRAALFRVAVVAGVVDAVASQQLRPDRTVRLVAVGAAHLALGQRVMRGLVEFVALLLVAGEADHGLGPFVAHPVVGRVQLMARGAGNVRGLVGTAVPVRALGIVLMAGEAGKVSQRNVGHFPAAISHRRLVDHAVRQARWRAGGCRHGRRHEGGVRASACAVFSLADRQQGG
jgi:hypothetical protein